MNQRNGKFGKIRSQRARPKTASFFTPLICQGRKPSKPGGGTKPTDWPLYTDVLWTYGIRIDTPDIPAATFWNAFLVRSNHPEAELVRWPVPHPHKIYHHLLSPVSRDEIAWERIVREGRPDLDALADEAGHRFVPRHEDFLISRGPEDGPRIEDYQTCLDLVCQDAIMIWRRLDYNSVINLDHPPPDYILGTSLPD